ncbi:class I adenylate-forming enzyme family protein [Nocardioides marmotae]|uniref:class I adenylate-forming enzyme family protein n=1 Tax=Nocardioides marmotae TaxID=2663857 RepID=UPI0012B5C3F6|nr:AMP-binding protein [Nocardioides marmotae]MBC9733243.1 AMP-binding protein [Nocardioides marmotae]MTB84354.1 AMP-binding protein [Nocardioides marmotae]
MSARRGEHDLALLAERSVERLGDHDTLLFEGTWHSSGSIHDRSTRVAAGLREIGIGVGDRVVVLMMNTPEVFVTYRAVWRAGAVVTPVIFLQTPPELRHILTDSGARAVVVTPELLPLLQAASEGLDLEVLVVGEEGEPTPGTRPYADLEAADPLPLDPRADDDLAALLYTGGTTGRAKGVMLSHRGLWESGAGLETVARTMDTTRSLLPLPLSHVYGLNVVIAGLHSDRRGISVLQRWFDAPGWVRLVEEHRLESSPVVPSMLALLMAEPLEEHDLSCLRSFGSGGAPLAGALREAVEKRLGVVILEGYGCTEASSVVTASTMDANRPGSVGRPVPHAEVAILDPDGRALPAGEDGEICVRGPGVMLGYWHEPELTARTVVDGWLHTGDIGHLDDDGFLHVVDRLKDLIIRGGFNVYPRDVEDALLTHPEVTSAACVGRPDPVSGEEVVAVVAVQPGSTLTGEDLVAYAKGRLAAHKYPREVVVADAVPLTSVGKTDRKAVRAILNG